MKKSEKDEVVKIVKSELKKFASDELDKEIKKLLEKSNTGSRKEMIQAIKDAMEAAFKLLWVKRDFWKTDIK